MLENLETILTTIFYSLNKLLPAAAVFFLFAFLVKGKNILLAIRQSLPESLFNIAFMSLNAVILTPILIICSKFITSFNIPAIPPNFWADTPKFLVIFLAVFFGDFIGYWRHRLEHSKILWPSHRVHHSDSQMTWLTLERFHPINRITTFLIDATFLLSLGFPAYAIVANSIVRHYYGYFIHADLPWTYGKLGLIFVSPAMHRWHHVVDKSAHNTNFATVFSVFDRCFGTYSVPGICNVPLGVASSKDKTFIGQLLHPFKPKSYIIKSKLKTKN